MPRAIVALLTLLVSASVVAQSNCDPNRLLTVPSNVTGEITIGSCKQGSEYHDIFHIQNLPAGKQLRFVLTRTTLPSLHLEITYVQNLTIKDIYNKYEYSKTTIVADIEVPVSGQINIFVAGAASYSTGGYTLAVSDLPQNASSLVVPIVGHVTGAGGSAFRSDVKLYNPGSVVITGNLVFTPRGQSASGGDRSIAFTIAPLGVVTYEDVYAVGVPGTDGAARLKIEYSGNVAPVVDTSTYTKLSDGGELAQSPTVLTATDYRSGPQAAVIGKAAERTNVFVMTGPQDVTVYWRYRDANGVLRSTATRTYARDATFQFAINELVGAAPTPNGTLEADIQIGYARIALSPVNNISNQGRWVDFKPLP